MSLTRYLRGEKDRKKEEEKGKIKENRMEGCSFVKYALRRVETFETRESPYNEIEAISPSRLTCHATPVAKLHTFFVYPLLLCW